MHRRGLFALVMASLTLVAIRTLHAQDARKPFKPEELDQILAPIALYPDALLSQVLMAATYPLEVVEAARWSKANPSLKGDAAVAAVKDKNWDVSVMSLTAFPQVLVQLDDHLDWTQKLGDAMIGQEQDVADSIQRLRAKAADAGNLKSGKEQTVAFQGSGDDRMIVIEQADPNVIYVPAYNPSWAYGSWPYPAYPPVYYPPPPGYGYGAALVGGFLFGAGILATGALFGGWNWGRGNSYVNVNVNRAVSINNNFDRNRFTNNNRWQHDPGHRRGVAYRDPATSQRFGQNRAGADQRQQFRGRLEGNPGGGQIASRPQANARPNVPQRPAGGQQPASLPNRGSGTQGPRGGGGLSGVNRGQQVNREATRGRAEQQRATSQGGGAGGARAGVGTRPAGGGGGRPGGGGGQAGGGARGGR